MADTWQVHIKNNTYLCPPLMVFLTVFHWTLALNQYILFCIRKINESAVWLLVWAACWSIFIFFKISKKGLFKSLVYTHKQPQCVWASQRKTQYDPLVKHYQSGIMIENACALISCFFFGGEKSKQFLKQLHQESQVYF